MQRRRSPTQACEPVPRSEAVKELKLHPLWSPSRGPSAHGLVPWGRPGPISLQNRTSQAKATTCASWSVRAAVTWAPAFAGVTINNRGSRDTFTSALWERVPSAARRGRGAGGGSAPPAQRPPSVLFVPSPPAFFPSAAPPPPLFNLPSPLL